MPEYQSPTITLIWLSAVHNLKISQLLANRPWWYISYSWNGTIWCFEMSRNSNLTRKTTFCGKRAWCGGINMNLSKGATYDITFETFIEMALILDENIYVWWQHETGQHQRYFFRLIRVIRTQKRTENACLMLQEFRMHTLMRKSKKSNQNNQNNKFSFTIYSFWKEEQCRQFIVYMVEVLPSFKKFKLNISPCSIILTQINW